MLKLKQKDRIETNFKSNNLFFKQILAVFFLNQGNAKLKHSLENIGLYYHNLQLTLGGLFDSFNEGGLPRSEVAPTLFS